MLKKLTKIWPLILLAIIVIVSQIVILKPHLKYGFSDVDWGFLSIYKTQNPYSLTQFIDNWKVGGTTGGLYTHQIYYIGIQEHFFGLNFESFQQTTHIFKILATLATFPIFLAISGSLLIAFISTILFGFSYSSVGPMYTVVTSSDYAAIFCMGLFALSYWYLIKKSKFNWLLAIISLILFLLTLFISTERMYPLPLFIITIELFLIWTFKGWFNNNTLKRVTVILSPLILLFLARPKVFLYYFSDHAPILLRGIELGNWNLLLTPFIVLGSIIVPHDYTKYFGSVNMDSFLSFLDFFISGPFIILTVVIFIIGVIFFKGSYRLIFQNTFLTIISAILVYILGNHFVDHLISKESIVQAIIGLYILSVAFVSFKYWFKSKERLLIGLFAGPFLAFIYIFLTWIAASPSEIFSGAHRYLTVPTLGMSFFIGTLFAISFIRLLNLPKKYNFFKFFAIIPLFLLLMFIRININEIQAFFNGQLKNGFGAADKQMMRGQLLGFLSNISSTHPSLLYFDFTEDRDNGYYYDNTVLGGLGTWLLWHPRINFNDKLLPTIFWNNYEMLKSSYVNKDNERGFLLKGAFFGVNDFYAFKLKDKKVIDIKEELLSSFGR